MKRSNPNQRLWLLAATMAVVGALALVIPGLPDRPTVDGFPWWVLIPAFALVEAFAIHLPTRRSAHTVSASEIPMVVGLAFLSPILFVVSRMIGTLFSYVAVRRQTPLKLAFNSSMLFLDSVVIAIAFHAILGGAEVVEPRGWVAALAAVAISVTLGAGMVSVAIAMHDHETSFRERTRALTAGFVISLGMGFVGVLWMFVLWHDARALALLLITSVPVLMALAVYERLARRHDELDVAYALTKDLESRTTPESVAEAGLERVADVLMPDAAVVLAKGSGPLSFFEADEESLIVADSWEETLRYHGDVCDEGRQCACAKRMLGGGWAPALTYRLVDGDGARGVLVVRPRTGRGTEISEADHRMLQAIAAQVSSAMTRIEALCRLEREIDEKQALVRSKDQLIASVSHELRTPLTGIIGFAELLVDDGGLLTPADIEHAKRHIATEAHDLGNIVEDLLTAARADLGALEIQAKPVSTRTEIDRALSHLRDGSTVKVSGPDSWVRADAPRVRQILRNLLTNAMKYGGSHIEVETEPLETEVVLTVSDDGSGVPVDRIESIFEPYESAHFEPSQPGSLGLGLSISRSLARLMGGDLSYDRVDGRTAFRLRLPVLAGAIQPTIS